MSEIARVKDYLQSLQSRIVAELEELDGKEKKGKSPNKATIEGDLIYTCPLTGKEFEWEYKAKITGDKMVGDLDGNDGDATGTFKLKRD